MAGSTSDTGARVVGPAVGTLVPAGTVLTPSGPASTNPPKGTSEAADAVGGSMAEDAKERAIRAKSPEGFPRVVDSAQLARINGTPLDGANGAIVLGVAGAQGRNDSGPRLAVASRKAAEDEAAKQKKAESKKSKKDDE